MVLLLGTTEAMWQPITPIKVSHGQSTSLSRMGRPLPGCRVLYIEVQADALAGGGKGGQGAEVVLGSRGDGVGLQLLCVAGRRGPIGRRLQPHPRREQLRQHPVSAVSAQDVRTCCQQFSNLSILAKCEMQHRERV